MKTIKRVLLALGIIFTLHQLSAQTTPNTIVSVVAAEEGLDLLSPDAVPTTGTFWLVMPALHGGVNALMPCPAFNFGNDAVYGITDDQFLVDGTTNDVSGLSDDAIAAQAQPILDLVDSKQAAETHRFLRSMGMDDGPPSPGEGGDGGGDTNSYLSSGGIAIDTNQLWLEITNVSYGTAFANLHRATNQVYSIWSSTNLATPFASWNVESELWPGDTNCQPFTVPTLDRQDLFLRAEDWTGVDSDGDGIPDWWIWKYFGNLSENSTNLDSQGNTLGDDYTSNLDPNVISFNLQVANNYVSTSDPNLQLNVTAGTPSYYTVLVGSTNFATTNWTAYTSSTITAKSWHGRLARALGGAERLCARRHRDLAMETVEAGHQAAPDCHHQPDQRHG